jgi:DNA processing protein
MEAREIQKGETEYPVRLGALPAAPSPLWIRGRWVPAPRAVAIIGARAASVSRLAQARQLGAALARAGLDVISGGALGIDAAAHEGAVLSGGSGSSGHTVAVLGTGIDVIYPERNAPLFAEIVRSGGALVTQFPAGATPRKGAFPIRNWLIAAFADVVVVVEAGAASGTAHTVRAARKLGRPVAAVAGSLGTDRLIVEGAHAVSDADEVLGLLDGRAPAPPAAPDDPILQRLYAALDHVPRDVGELAFLTGVAVGACASMVVELELGGLAARAAGGRYLRLR